MNSGKQILYIVLCFMTLLSTSSFIIGIHRCKKQADDIALFSKAVHCAHEQITHSCCCHSPASKGCCSDDTIIHRSDEPVSSAEVNITMPKFKETSENNFVLAETIPAFPVLFVGHADHDPPAKSHDLVVILLTFLI